MSRVINVGNFKRKKHILRKCMAWFYWFKFIFGLFWAMQLGLNVYHILTSAWFFPKVFHWLSLEIQWYFPWLHKLYIHSTLLLDCSYFRHLWRKTKMQTNCANHIWIFLLLINCFCLPEEWRVDKRHKLQKQ